METVLQRYALLHGVKDGAVARWLLDSLPEPVPIEVTSIEDWFPGPTEPSWVSGDGLHRFVSPSLRLSGETMSRAVESCSTTANAVFLGVLFQLGSSGRAVGRMRSLRKRVLAHSYEDQRPGAVALDVLARKWDGPVGWRTVHGSRTRCKWGDLDAANATAAYGGRALNLTWLGTLLWRHLGDDPGAWSLACDLLEENAMEIGDVLDVTAATMPSQANRRDGHTASHWSWRWRPPTFSYRGERLIGL